MSLLVSILVPVFNRETIIAETLRAALCQTYAFVEVVVVDNASTDNTWEIIQEFARNDVRIKAFRNKSNLGPVRNWLRCIEEATGEYGKILWSDDLISPEFLEECMALMDENTGFVYSGVKIFTDSPSDGRAVYSIGQTGHYPSLKYLRLALLDRDVPVSPGCAIFRMSDIRNNLLLNIENKVGSDFSMHAIGNDLLLFLLTANKYPLFGFVNKPLAFFRSHLGSITVSSTDGKIPLHYALVRAYYVERYCKDLMGEVVFSVWSLLRKYPDHRKYGFSSVQDFFSSNISLNLRTVLIPVLKRGVRLPWRIIRKIFRSLGFGRQ
ncbi:glycosyltransferase family 2 protein [Pseudomonas sp. CNPSo 3701]|uniref:glycosyltransferase family 2 protein n=1 Tax=Pseudomonas sp. CNPSo 3701 TaxID=3027943 RepID=UPI002363C0C3|nr:glycosyltransferase family 2 protein [Pseudomonas sp. CNPSo 3701]MDD1508258.1 glycosyltransferase family 2 protein [Pseudomonas sp. CNPSo 3701]